MYNELIARGSLWYFDVQRTARLVDIPWDPMLNLLPCNLTFCPIQNNMFDIHVDSALTG